jgi:hypothetical protein
LYRHPTSPFWWRRIGGPNALAPAARALLRCKLEIGDAADKNPRPLFRFHIAAAITPNIAAGGLEYD